MIKIEKKKDFKLSNDYKIDTYNKLKSFFDYMVLMSSDTGFNRFFVRTKTHVMITILVASRSINFFSFEKLCYQIPSHVASRSTIKSILDDGVKQSFYHKFEFKDDRRIQLYKLNSENFNLIQDWVKMQHKIFK